MDWNNCFTSNTTRTPDSTSNRTQYQRDYDKLIFSSSFRRLQGKTQVFPLPGNTFVHNRLTHSLEVASVGRSLGNIVGAKLANNQEGILPSAKEFYKYDLGFVISSACLAHDCGNPPFGHSGENAISDFFISNGDFKVEHNSQLKDYFSEQQWKDLTSFEGNANAFHILTKKYEGKAEGGLGLTFTTLASLLKYPVASVDVVKGITHRKKYGYFDLDVSTLENVAKQTNMVADTSTSEVGYQRHPFVYLVEAADDICYRLIDIEDAHRLSIITTAECLELFQASLADILSPTDKTKTDYTLGTIEDINEKISYLRAKLINALVMKSGDVFEHHKDNIISCNWTESLYDVIESDSKALRDMKYFSIDRIYNHPTVIQLEITGYHVIHSLLQHFIPLGLKSNLTNIEKKTKSLVPPQYRIDSSDKYLNTINILDYIAGMTDGYATELYRKTQGIDIAGY